MYAYTPPEKRYRNAKYILPYVIGFFILMCLMQISAQFVKVEQLNKASGSITSVNTRIKSYNKSHKPIYALTVTLDKGDGYDITDKNARAKLEGMLQAGDDVVIYYPTTLYKILSVGFAQAVNQVEWKNEVVYSFDEQKRQAHLLIIMFAVMAGIFGGLRYYLMRVYSPQ